MATVVINRQNGHRFLVVGTGFGMSESATPGLFFGNLAPNVAHNTVSLVAVCGVDGVLGWFRFDEVQVVEVDGKPPHDWLVAEPTADDRA